MTHHRLSALLLAVAGFLWVDVSVAQDAASLSEFQAAVASRDLDRATAIADAGVRQGGTMIEHREWLSRLGEVSVLRNDMGRAVESYAESCAYPASVEHAVMDAECAGGLALIEVLDPGESDESEPLLATAMERLGAEPAPSAVVLTHMAAAMQALNFDPEASVTGMRLVEDALNARGIKENPDLTALVAAALLKVAEIYWANDIDQSSEELQLVATDHSKRAVALHSSILDRLEPELFFTLYNAATYSTEPEFVRTLVLWMVDMAEADPDPASAQNTFDLAVTHIHPVFLKDTLVEVLWRWQAHLEGQFGAESPEAAKGLIALADFMFTEMREEEGNNLRDKALAILAATVGEDSEVYQSAANSIAYTSYLASKEIMDRNQASIDATQSGEPLLPPARDYDEPLNPNIAAAVTAEVDAAIGKAGEVGGTDGIQQLMDTWGNILVGATGGEHWDDPKAEREFRKEQGERLMGVAWSMALEIKAFDHYTFSGVAGRMADAEEEHARLPAAIAFLDGALQLAEGAASGKVVARVRLLAEYADLLGQEPDYQDADFVELSRSTIAQRFDELVAIAPQGEDEGKALLEALVDFGDAFVERQEPADANRAFELARALAETPEYADDYERDEITTALAKLGGKDPVIAEADVTWDRIGKMSDGDPSKVMEFESAAQHYEDIEVNWPQALRFVREAVRLEKQQIMEIVGSMPLSGSDELESRKGYFESTIRLNMTVLVSDPTRNFTDAEADLREALDLFQWRRNLLAGNALLRSSARATLEPAERGLARELDLAIAEWQTLEQELIDGALAGRPQAELAALTDEQARLHRTVEEATDVLAERSEVFRGLSGRGGLSLDTLQSAILPGEAVIAFARSDYRGLFALVVTPTGGALVDLERDADGNMDYDRLDMLQPAFDGFQQSFLSSEPFDFESAATLYSTLFRPLEPFLQGAKRLVIVPDVSFPSLSYAALVTEPPSDPTDAEWMIRKYAMTTALSLESFAATRSQPEMVGGAEFLGFANPRIDNPTCPPASLFGSESGAEAEGLCELPETLDHVGFVAQGLAADPEASILRGEFLTKANVAERLRHPARVVVFATHGMMGEEMSAISAFSEPALLLSATAGEPDVDRWLRTSEIDRMTIDAEVVILSACNTSANSAAGGQAFSGLARAFFEAGARSLLVTNWYIDASQTSEFLRLLAPRLAGVRKSDLADVLRETMLERIPTADHPKHWAVFTILGG